MKMNTGTALALAFGLLSTPVALGQAAAASPAPRFTSQWTTTEGFSSYNYVSPATSIYAAVGVGGDRTTLVVQNSALNLAVVTQAGTNLKTIVVQQGVSNGSLISQLGRHSTAVVIQFGSPFSLLGGP